MGDRALALAAICQTSKVGMFDGLSSVLQAMLPVIEGWSTAPEEATIQWMILQHRVKVEKSDFDLVVYQGILDFARVLNQRKADASLT